MLLPKSRIGHRWTAPSPSRDPPFNAFHLTEATVLKRQRQARTEHLKPLFQMDH